jgi:MFS family permease
VGIALTSSFPAWAAGMILLGAGTAMVYPTLLAAIGDVAHPTWRAAAVGVYRFWRADGFAVGAVAAGLLADTFSLTTAVWAVAALTAASGLVVAVRMYETHRPATADQRCPCAVKVMRGGAATCDASGSPSRSAPVRLSGTEVSYSFFGPGWLQQPLPRPARVSEAQG